MFINFIKKTIFIGGKDAITHLFSRFTMSSAGKPIFSFEPFSDKETLSCAGELRLLMMKHNVACLLSFAEKRRADMINGSPAAHDIFKKIRDEFVMCLAERKEQIDNVERIWGNSLMPSPWAKQHADQIRRRTEQIMQIFDLGAALGAGKILYEIYREFVMAA
jgi:hypothetical protein